MKHEQLVKKLEKAGIKALLRNKGEKYWFAEGPRGLLYWLEQDGIAEIARVHDGFISMDVDTAAQALKLLGVKIIKGVK